MPLWDVKRAGLICDAVTTYMGSVDDATERKQLSLILRKAKDASTTASTTAGEINALHSELCAYCTGKSLFNCKGHQYQIECAFMESAFGLRTSQFDRLI